MLIITAAITGAGAGILWVAQGKFLTLCATNNNRGFIAAYFWMIFMGSQIIGNLIAAKVLHSGAQKTTLFILFSIMAVVGSLLMLVLKVPAEIS